MTPDILSLEIASLPDGNRGPLDLMYHFSSDENRFWLATVFDVMLQSNLCKYTENKQLSFLDFILPK